MLTDSRFVVKRNGKLEKFDFEKVHKVLFWATEDIAGVSVSEIEVKAHMQLYDKIQTADIHETMIKSAADLISEESPNYQYVAARLVNFQLRKQVYKNYVPDHVYDHVKKNIELNVYDDELLSLYSKDEWDKINKMIKHDRDNLLSYAAMEQFRGKYLVQDRTTGEYYETPQMAYILISAILFSKYPKDTRLTYVKNYYDAISKGPKSTITLATPILAGIRTKTRQFSSCFPAGQQVRTRDGLKSIETIVPDDIVLTHTGEWQPVVATREKKYTGNNFITLRSQYSIPYDYQSTEDHLVRTITKENKKNERACWLRADQLKKGDLIQIPFNKHVTHETSINVATLWNEDTTIKDGKIYRTNKYSSGSDDRINGINANISIDEKLLRFLGYYLAEGYTSKDGRKVELTFNRNEVDYIEDVKRLTVDVFGINCTEHYHPTDLSMKLCIHNRGVAAVILHLCGTGFNTKYINDVIMRTDPSIQQELLIGVIRGDGCIHKNGMTLAMSNRELIQQLGEMSLRVGLFPSLGYKSSYQMNKVPSRQKSNIFTTKDSYTLNMGISGNVDFLMSVGKHPEKLDINRRRKPRYSKYTQDGDYFCSVLDVKKIDNNGNSLVYDLQIDNVHSFVVSSIGVHNCVLIETDDSLDSINETASAIVDYASRRAGIGLNAGRIRAKGAKVRGGEVFHTGNIPFYKYFLAALKSCSQGGIRGASATTYFPLWHLEAEDLIVLKNNKGTDETRVRHMDYGVQLNGYLYKRLLSNQNITLFSPDEVPDLYDAFFEDQELFAELYEKYERSRSIRKRTVPALELISSVLMERNNTGRIYIHNVDHTNTHGSFNEKTSPIRMSNLCVEIVTSTAPLTRKSRIPYLEKFYKDIEDTMSCSDFREEYGEISLCTLSSINIGVMQSPDDFEKPADLAVRALDELLDYQDYPVIAAGVPAKNRRNIGIGICNLAYFIAKQGAKYSDGSANEIVNKYAEAMSYYVIKASNTLAKEKGPCRWYNETKYSKGILPIDTYKNSIDDLVGKELRYDWEELRKSIIEHGMRHSTTMALMPVESSSQVINATNGIEPVRSSVTIKGSKDGTLKQVVPEIHRLKNKYEYLWDMPNTRGYLEIAAIFQKYIDQSISTNTSYNPINYEDNKIPMSELIKDLVYSYKLGIKTLYYQNTDDGSGEVEFEDEECSSCKL